MAPWKDSYLVPTYQLHPFCYQWRHRRSQAYLSVCWSMQRRVFVKYRIVYWQEQLLEEVQVTSSPTLPIQLSVVSLLPCFSLCSNTASKDICSASWVSSVHISLLCLSSRALSDASSWQSSLLASAITFLITLLLRLPPLSAQFFRYASFLLE